MLTNEIKIKVLEKVRIVPKSKYLSTACLKVFDNSLNEIKSFRKNYILEKELNELIAKAQELNKEDNLFVEIECPKFEQIFITKKLRGLR